MISKNNIKCYRGLLLSRGNDYIYIQPNALLLPYIPCYTITFPSDMSDDYAILPSASSTIVISVSDNEITGSLRGVNTRVCNVGKHANKRKFLLLIEFHSGCFFPFVKINQSEFVDLSFDLNDIDKSLMQSIENTLLKFKSIETLIISLDRIFIDRIDNSYAEKTIKAIKNKILAHNGNISVSELSSSFHYSEKHIQRLFTQYIGTNPKVFSRIVRVNYTLRLLQSQSKLFTDVAMQAGFFDQPHFIHDFKSICGLTPQDYIRSMSDFYNDNFKF